MELILEEMAAREFIPLDTVICDPNGAFRISFSKDREAFYALRREDGAYSTLLIKPGEHLKYTGAADRSGSYLVEGSHGSELLQKLSAEHKETLGNLAAIAREKSERHYDPDFVDLSLELEGKFDSIREAFQAYSREFILENKSSLAIMIALYNLYGQGLPVFHPAEDLDMYVFVDSVLGRTHPDSEFVRELHVHVTEATAGKATAGIGSGKEVGEIAPDFVSSRPDGRPVALTEFRGSYVLLVFWASWSEGSREENPVLRKAWERHGNQGLEIIQVGFESDRQAWLEAVEADAIPGVQLSDLKGWDCPVADLYQVERIPSNYLLGPGGKILAKDLYGEELLQRLEQIIENENEK